MKKVFGNILVLLLIISSCDGIKRIHIYNISLETVLVRTSKPRAGIPQKYLEEYPNLKLEPADSLTKSQRVTHYKNLLRTDNLLIKNSNSLDITLTPKSSIIIGGRRTLILTGNIKPSDLYIDTLTIFLKDTTIKVYNRADIIELSKKGRFKYKISDKEYIKANSKASRNIVIR